MAKRFIDSISIKSPCSESWGEMTGNDKVRFCSHCAKNVHNLSEMTRRQAEALVKRSNGNLCVRYRAGQNGKIITQPNVFTQITRRTAVAAGVLAASLAAGTAVYAQGSTYLSGSNPQQEQETLSKANRSSKSTADISGVVMDENGALIIDAKITLFRVYNENEKVKVAETAPLSSGISTGRFFLRNLEYGDYELLFQSPGFEQLKKRIRLEPDTEIEVTATLVVGVLMGDVIIIDYRQG